MTKITTETKEEYKKRFWFIKNLAERVGENFLICSEEIAYAFLWELCERIQEELTDTSKVSTGRLITISAFINSLHYAEDGDIVNFAEETYNMKYIVKGKSCDTCQFICGKWAERNCKSNAYDNWVGDDNG